MACIPGPSIFSLVHLAWAGVLKIQCVGLHNKPIEKLINFAYDGQKIIAFVKSNFRKKIRNWFAEIALVF